jgi:hypothetical protein
MLDIQQLICSMKKVEPIFVYFLQEGAAQMELIVNIIIEYHLLNNQVLLTNQKMFLEEPDFLLLDKT